MNLSVLVFRVRSHCPNKYPNTHSLHTRVNRKFFVFFCKSVCWPAIASVCVANSNLMHINECVSLWFCHYIFVFSGIVCCCALWCSLSHVYDVCLSVCIALCAAYVCVCVCIYDTSEVMRARCDGCSGVCMWKIAFDGCCFFFCCWLVGWFYCWFAKRQMQFADNREKNFRSFGISTWHRLVVAFIRLESVDSAQLVYDLDPKNCS